MSKASLLARCQGPGAIEIGTLVQRAQKSANAICRDYGNYVLENLQAIEQLAAACQDDTKVAENHKIFLQAILDLRSSAAMAGYDWIAQYSQSLVNVLTTREVSDPALPVIVGLHLDAIKIAAQGKSSPDELRHLETNLKRAVEKLG